MSAPKKPKAEAPAKNAKNAEHSPDAAAKTGGGLKSKLLVGVFVSGVVIAETVVFFLMVPSGEEVAALAESRLIAVAQEIDAKKSHEDAHDDSDTIVEFEFGEPFNVSFIPPGVDQSYRVQFKLFGTLKKSDLEHLQALYAERALRFRHRMNLEIRNASLQELQENQLGLIQRRVLATSTELLGEAILLSVGFSDYQVLED